MKKIFSLFAVLLFAVSAMASTAYCDVPSGHLGNADFGDRNACVKLTIVQSMEAGIVDVTLSMNRDLSATSKIDYLYVLYNGLPYTAGTDDNGDAFDELTAHVNVGSAESGNLMIQYSNPNWGGRWQIDLTDVDFTNSCGGQGGSTISEYCNYYGVQTKQDGKYCSITWITNSNGDVVINLSDGPSASDYTGVSFRDDCFEGSFDLFKVVSSNGEENASVYFTRERSAADNYYILRKNDTPLPEGTITIKTTATLAWTSNENASRWQNSGALFSYTYGTTCPSLEAPANVAVANDGTITFDAVDDAISYEVYVYNGETEVYTGPIASGDVIDYQVYVAMSLTVKVAAVAGGVKSEKSTGVAWNPAVTPLPASIWCETAGVATTKNNWGDAHFTINTLANGNVTIIITSPNGSAASFRKTRGMNGTFKLNGSTAEFNTYFTGSKTSDDTFTLALVDPANKPAIGSVIDYSGQIECATSQNGDDWSNYNILGYIYGTTCPDIPVAGVTLDKTTASVPVNKTLTLVATVTPNNAADKSLTWTSSATAVATVADGVVTPVTEGTTVITVTTDDGGFTATCTVTVTAANATEPNALPVAPTYAADKVKAIHSATYSVEANYGNWGGSQSFTKEAYGIKIIMNAGNGYCGLVGFPAINANTMEYLHADVWIEDDASLRFVPIVTGQGEHGVTANLVGGQWNAIDLALNAAGFASYNDWTNVFQLKIDMAAGLTFWINNVYFYTTSEDDVTKPVMTSASLESVSYMSAIINVAATDDRGVAKYVVKNGATEIGKFIPADGKITVTGLTDATNYTLSIYAEDATENVSDNSVNVELTTLALPAAPAAPNVAGKDYVSVYAPALTNMLKHDFVLANWGSAAGSKIDEKGYVFYHTTNNATVVWGENNAGGNAIVAVDAYKGSKGGLDASAMEYMHFDIWADKDGCNSLVVVVNDHNLGAAQTLNAGWNSLDIALSEFAATPDNNYLLDNVAWIKFTGLNNTNDVAITNVYFWKEAETYVRTVTAGNYGTICLAKAATLEGATAFEVVGKTETAIVLNEVAALAAGVPYIFEATADELVATLSGDAVAEAGSVNGLVGSFEGTNVDEGMYVISGNTVKLCGTGCSIGANRAYINLANVPAATPAPEHRVIAITDVATALENANAENVVKMMENGQLIIIKNGVRYNALGQVVK